MRWWWSAHTASTWLGEENGYWPLRGSSHAPYLDDHCHGSWTLKSLVIVSNCCFPLLNPLWAGIPSISHPRCKQETRTIMVLHRKMMLTCHREVQMTRGNTPAYIWNIAVYTIFESFLPDISWYLKKVGEFVCSIHSSQSPVSCMIFCWELPTTLSSSPPVRRPPAAWRAWIHQWDMPI